MNLFRNNNNQINNPIMLLVLLFLPVTTVANALREVSELKITDEDVTNFLPSGDLNFLSEEESNLSNPFYNFEADEESKVSNLETKQEQTESLEGLIPSNFSSSANFLNPLQPEPPGQRITNNPPILSSNYPSDHLNPQMIEKYVHDSILENTEYLTKIQERIYTVEKHFFQIDSVLDDLFEALNDTNLRINAENEIVDRDFSQVDLEVAKGYAERQEYLKSLQDNLNEVRKEMKQNNDKLKSDLQSAGGFLSLMSKIQDFQGGQVKQVADQVKGVMDMFG